MQVLIAQIINGLSLGSIYVLLVTGFNLLLLVAMIIHFAYPQVVEQAWEEQEWVEVAAEQSRKPIMRALIRKLHQPASTKYARESKKVSLKESIMMPMPLAKA